MGVNSSNLQLDSIKEITSDMTVLLATNGEYKFASELTVFFDDFDSYHSLYTKIRQKYILQNTTDLPKDLLEYTRKLLLEYHPHPNKAVRFKSNLLYEYSWEHQPRDFVPCFSSRYYDEIY